MIEELGDAVAEPCVPPADDDPEAWSVADEPEESKLADADAFEAGSAGESGISVDVPAGAELKDEGELIDDFGPEDTVVEADDVAEVAPLDKDPDEAALLVPNPRIC
ncbi:hypothetical protein MMC34_002001 [Xylographa carneopallida]|nr:hypothetical protein [Xylographa carneopallida]